MMDTFNRIIQKQHELYNKSLTRRWGWGYKLVNNVLFHFIRWYYHCEIPYCIDIEGVHFCHSGFGVVINKNAKIGRGTDIQHRVTIGQTNKGVPVIGENCYIGAGAIIIGAITIGNNVKIGAGAVVISDIPDNTTAVGVPA